MAIQTAVKKASEVAPAPRAPRVPKGPNGPKHNYERYGQTISRPETFTSYLDGYPDKTGLILYVHRLVPKIDLSLIGVTETNICKISDPAEMTFENIAERFGRGRYHFKLNDANRAKGENQVAKITFSLDDAEKPPVYDIRTLLLGAPENTDEVNRLVVAGVLVRDASGAPRIRTAEDGPQSEAGANGFRGPAPAPELIDKATINTLVLESFRGRVSQDPATVVKQSIELARMLAPPAPAFTVEALAEQVAAKLGGRPAGVLDDFSVYERVEGFIAKFRPAAPAVIPADGDGAAGGGGFSAWAPHAAGIIGQIRAAIPEIVGAVKMLRVNNNGAGAAGAPRQVTGAQPMTLEQRIEQVCMMGFQKMSEGVSGFDFASYVVHFLPGGREVFDFLDTNGGAAGLMGLIAMKPETRALTADPVQRQQIETFLVSFFEFDSSPVPASDVAGAAGVSSN